MKVVKICTACKKEKNLEDFNSFRNKINKQCRDCRNYHNIRWSKNVNGEKEKRREYQREFKEKYKNRYFKNDILKKYNLSVEIYEKMLSDQKNRCAICSVEFNLERNKKNINSLPCIDHCHQTNKVRALLCRKCNIFLGVVESGFYDKAKEYLRAHGQDKELDKLLKIV